jgi:hypothetical protein
MYLADHALKGAHILLDISTVQKVSAGCAIMPKFSGEIWMRPELMQFGHSSGIGTA